MEPDRDRVLDMVTAKLPLAVDLETGGTNPWQGDRILGVALANDEDEVYVPFSHVGSENWPVEDQEEMLELLKLRRHTVVMHNALFDASFLGFWPKLLWDTMVFAWLEDENQRLSLKELAGDRSQADALKEKRKAHCRDCGSKKSKVATKKDAEEHEDVEWKARICKTCKSPNWLPRRGFGDLTYDEMRDYAALDARMTVYLYAKQGPLLGVDVDRDALDRELRVLRVCWDMMMTGLPVDLRLAQTELKRCQARAAELEEELPFNVRSPKQVGEYLTEERNLKLPVKEETGHIETDLDALIRHQSDEVVAQILEHRDVTKEGQFYEKLLELVGTDGRVHPRWRPQGTVSGRFSCSEPNAQQWPKKGHVRDCIVPPDGYTLLTADLSQAELRVAANYSKSERLIEWFNAGEDVYQKVANELGIERQSAKIVVLSSLYGVGGRKMRKILLRAGIDVTQKEATAWLKGWRALVPELGRGMDKAEAVAWRRGYVKLVQPGRFRHFEGAPMWKAHPKDAWNAIIQGGVAECIKNLMLQTDELAVAEPGWDVQLVAQVHDSLSWFVPSGHLVEKWKDVVEAAWEELNPFRVVIPLEFEEGL